MTEHEPMMSPERAERIRRWHEDALRGIRRTETVELDYLGATLVVPPDVFCPTPTSPLLGRAVLDRVRPDDRVLDMGTGCGVNAILAARTSSDVQAVDVNAAAVAAAQANVERNGVADRVRVRESDLFDAVEGDVDVIIIDPPFRWFAAADMLERATADEGYRALTAFFAEAPGRLRPGGRVLLFFGSSGDIDYLHHLSDEAGFVRTVVEHRDLEKDGFQVTYVTYELTLTS